MMKINQFYHLRQANIARDKLIDPENKIDLLWRGVELGGETGELLNMVKKLVREQKGISGSRVSLSDMGKEAADVVICLDLLCMDLGIDLWSAVVEKFNATSDLRNLPVKL